jgi:protein Mpv17
MPSTRLLDRYIFNTLPLPHTLLLVILLTVTLRIAASFHFHYGARPVLTLCVVSSLLASISDTLAQTVETIRARAKAAAKSKDAAVLDGIEMNEKTPSPGRDSPAGRGAGSFTWTSAERPVEFDFPRMIRFMGYGFLFAPIAVLAPRFPCIDWKYTWFGILDRHFPATGFGQVLLRTLVDQVCMSPFGLALFFTFITLAEGGGQRALKRKFLEVAQNLGPARLMIGILACTEGELLSLACCADHQFQVYAIATPNPFCQYGRSVLVRTLSASKVTVGTCI